MTYTVRRLTDDDAEASRRLGAEAFGVPATPWAEPAVLKTKARSSFGSFDEDGTLVARTVEREYDSWYGGAALPTAGIAGVTVAAEYRSQGALAPLFAEMLGAAKARGAVVSTLFPTAPRIYRRFGYEVITEKATVQLASTGLAAVRRPEGVRTRRARPDDVAALRTVYDTWAAGQNGPLTRRGVSFEATDEEFLAEFTGVTVAVDDGSDGGASGSGGRVRGYVSWMRGQGYGEGAVLEIVDLLAEDAAAYQALLLAMGSFSSVTPQTRIDTSGDDLVRLFLPYLDWRTVKTDPYMLKLLDVAGALTSVRYPAGFTAELAFALAGDFLPGNDGHYLLDIGAGRGSCVRAEHGGRVFTPQGLACMFAGAQSSANLRSVGHLHGGDADEDGVWDALFGGRQPHIRNYF